MTEYEKALADWNAKRDRAMELYREHEAATRAEEAALRKLRAAMAREREARQAELSAGA